MDCAAPVQHFKKEKTPGRMTTGWVKPTGPLLAAGSSPRYDRGGSGGFGRTGFRGDNRFLSAGTGRPAAIFENRVTPCDSTVAYQATDTSVIAGVVLGAPQKATRPPNASNNAGRPVSNERHAASAGVAPRQMPLFAARVSDRRHIHNRHRSNVAPLTARRPVGHLMELD